MPAPKPKSEVPSPPAASDTKEEVEKKKESSSKAKASASAKSGGKASGGIAGETRTYPLTYVSQNKSSLSLPNSGMFAKAASKKKVEIPVEVKTEESSPGKENRENEEKEAKESGRKQEDKVESEAPKRKKRGPSKQTKLESQPKRKRIQVIFPYYILIIGLKC